MTPARMRGLHLTADLQGCAGSPALLTETDALALLCKRLVDEVGLSPVAEKFHAFPDVGAQPGGVTGVVLLAESHLAVHTWPECAGVTVDVFVCNFSEDNSAKAERLLRMLIDAYSPTLVQTHRIERGL